MTDRPSAPASTQARAIAVMSVTSGESFAKTGTPGRCWRRTAATTSAAARGSQAKTWPRSSTLGQVMLTSTIARPGAAAQPVGELGVLVDAAAGDRHDGAGAALGQPRQVACSRKASMPGPCSPIELSIPLGVSAIRGVARPDAGASMIDLVTTPPRRVTSKNWSQLLARGGAAAGGEDRVGELHAGQPGAHVDRPGRRRVGLRGRRARSSVAAPAGGAPTASAGHRADVVPAHPVAEEHRPLDAGAHHARQAVVADDRQHAGHAHPDAAGHRLLDRDLATGMPRSAAELGDGPQHPHRAAGVDDVGAGARRATCGSTSLTRPRSADRAVVGRDASDARRSAWPRAGRRAGRRRRRRARSRPGSRARAARRPAGAAARCRSRRRRASRSPGRAGSRNGLPSGPTTSSWSCGRRAASQAVPLPCTAKTNSTVPP